MLNVPGESSGEVTQVFKVCATELCLIDIGKPAGVQTAGACSGIAIEIVEFTRPHAILAASDRRDRLALVAAPVTKRVLAAGIGRFDLAPRGAGWVEPIRTRVVEDHIEQHPQSTLMRLLDKLHKIVAAAESGIHLEEILDAVTRGRCRGGRAAGRLGSARRW